jgi:hypothetical protein
MTTAKTPPAAFDRHALGVAKGIAAIDRSKLPGLTTQFVAILQSAIVESMMMAAEETNTPRAAAVAADGQTVAPVEHGTADKPGLGKPEAALAEVQDIRGAVAEFRAQRRDSYPHEAVSMLLDAFEQLADIVERAVPVCAETQTGEVV